MNGKTISFTIPKSKVRELDGGEMVCVEPGLTLEEIIEMFGDKEEARQSQKAVRKKK